MSTCSCCLSETSADDTAKENAPTEPSEPTEEKPVEVDETHPEVQAMVAAAVKVAEEQTITQQFSSRGLESSSKLHRQPMRPDTKAAWQSSSDARQRAC